MTARRLIISAIPDDFDPARDLAVGPWCFVGREEVIPGWEDLPFADPFPTPDDWVAADAMARRLAHALVPQWAERLNHRLGRSYSWRFWRAYLLNWLGVAVPALWSRWRFVEALVEHHRTEPLVVRVMPDHARWGLDMSDNLLPFLWTADGDARLTSLVLRALAPAAWTLEVRDAPPPAASPTRPQPFGRLHRLLGRQAFGGVPVSPMARLALSAFIHLLPRRPANPCYRLPDPDAFEPFSDAFLTLLDTFLERVLPKSFESGFAALESRALAQTYHPGRLLVDIVNSEDDSLRIVSAMAHEKGERLVSCQHGGTYGTAKAMMVAAETEYPYDAFLTWGWTEQEDYKGRFIPVPSPELSALAGRHAERDKRLILVGASMVVHASRLGWLPKPAHYLAYRRAKLTFLGGLDGRVLDCAAYRPYRRNVLVLKDDEYVLAAHPDLELVPGNLDDALLNCRLAVIDHPITTILTVMAGHVPSLFFWDPQAWPQARQAVPVFDELRAAGILFDTPEACARQANAIWDDVSNWWNSAPVRAARDRFTRTYAHTSPRWWLDWMKALAGLTQKA